MSLEDKKMPISSSGNQSGRVGLKVFNILVALAFIALCGVLVYKYLGSPDTSKQTGPSRTTTGQKASPGQYLDITFYSSSAKKKWVDEMVKTFNDSGSKVGGNIVRVKQFHVNSGDSLDDLKDGKIRPDLWSPGDESWLELAAAHWRNVKQRTLFKEYVPLVNIPLVIAVWEPMAKALGYPKPVGWKDVAKIAGDPRGWEALGHPEWGKFRWGHAHPDANSGFLTIVSEVYASLDKTEGITPEDLKNPQVTSFLKEFEGAVEHYGLSNTWIDDLMHSKGPAYLSAAVQYENTIIEANEKYRNAPFKLVAVYPKEGAFWTRHPVALLEEEWMTPEKEEASKKFIDFLLSTPSQRRAMELGLRPIIKNLELISPFDDEHGVDPRIAPDKVFQVPDEAVLKRVRDLWEDVKVPATLVLVLDRSGSMKGKPMESAKEGAIHFVRTMKPRDQVEVVIFNNQITELSGFCLVKDCGETVVGRLDGVFAEGGTALHDVVLRSYKKLMAMRKKDPNRRYGIVVLTDGKDTSSSTSRHDLIDALPRGEDFDVPKIYTIAYGAEADRDLLAEISNRTNARLFSSSAETIAATYKELSANF
jgi:Ca-activated chloride channel family protein